MSKSKKICMAALICGILGLIGGWIPVVRNFTFILTIVAIVLGQKGRNDAEATAEEQKYAKIGFYLGIAGVVITVGAIIVTFALIGALM